MCIRGLPVYFVVDNNSQMEYIKDRKQSIHTGPGSRDRLRWQHDVFSSVGRVKYPGHI